MDMNIILGYVGALFVGVTLGLIGSGGSILSLPIFVYLFGLNPIIESAIIIIFFIAIMNPFVPNFYVWFLELFSKQIVKIEDIVLKTNKKEMLH